MAFLAPPSLPLSNLVTPFLARPEESVLKEEHRPVLVKKKNDNVGLKHPRNLLPHKYYHPDTDTDTGWLMVAAATIDNRDS